ncbi:serpin B8-like [Anticarsia gemmatalis]|uniref:serpin B8-like n=1 Tax=Anticarsia gemmatalis TaxID=129554 RepID=UPI003F7755DC
MQFTLWIISAVTTLCIQATGQSTDTTLDPELLSTTIAPQVENQISNVADAINNFSFKLLLKMMNKKKNENVVISPAGIGGLLAMTLLGSVGRTYDEIAEALGFSQDIFANRKNHEEFGELLQSLNNNITSKTLYADALFVDEQASLRDLYRDYLRDVYRGEVLSTDFKQSEEAKIKINEWVKNHTEGQIENFLKRNLPLSTKLVLLSALYFKGQWEHPFAPQYTAKMPFKKSTGEVMADLMLNFGSFPFVLSEKNDLIMVALPYNDSETVMYALKPRLPNKVSLLELMEKIDYKKIDETINELSTKKCVIRFPKMELKRSVNLEDTLKAIGIRDMFTPGVANFALMVNGNAIINKTEEELISRVENINGSKEESRGVKGMLDNLPNPGIHVDSVIHDVKLSINEYGTEAVAATSAILARSAEQFYANSPFYIFIRNSKTKLVTFSAAIFDPTI